MDSPQQPEVQMERSEAMIVYTVDSFANGIAFGQHKVDPHLDLRVLYALDLHDNSEVLPLRSRYALHKTNPLDQLESHLVRLSKQGVLRNAQIYFGTSTDPFYPFEGKFDASMRFLELFTKYIPGVLTVQTRSPLLVIAMPVLTKLGKHAAVTLGIETPSEECVERYTPRLPRVEERLKTARALRRFGIEVTLQVAPVLPYGDWKADARAFAEILVENSDFIHVRPLNDGSEDRERKLRTSPLAIKLADERRFHYLRPDAAEPLIAEIRRLAPEKLRTPERRHLQKKQTSLFAA